MESGKSVKRKMRLQSLMKVKASNELRFIDHGTGNKKCSLKYVQQSKTSNKYIWMYIK